MSKSQNDASASINKFELIKLVRENPCIYDTRMELYRNITLKMKIWSDIADGIGAPVVDCKRAWKTLRDRLRREEKKAMDRPVAWEYWDTLSFLTEIKPSIEFVLCSESKSEDQLIRYSFTCEEEGEEDVKHQAITFTNATGAATASSSNNSIRVENVNATATSPDDACSDGIALPRKRTADNGGNDLHSHSSSKCMSVSIDDEINEFLVKKKRPDTTGGGMMQHQNAEEDEDVLFGKTVASMIKGLPLLMKNNVKQTIFNAVIMAQNQTFGLPVDDSHLHKQGDTVTNVILQEIQ